MKTASMFRKAPFKPVPSPGLRLSGKKQYGSVGPTLNTGPTTRNQIVLSDAKAARLKNESFGRVTAKKLADLMAENESENQPLNLSTPQPFLLIADIRPRSEYNRLHIRNGHLISVVT